MLLKSMRAPLFQVLLTVLGAASYVGCDAADESQEPSQLASSDSVFQITEGASDSITIPIYVGLGQGGDLATRYSVVPAYPSGDLGDLEYTFKRSVIQNYEGDNSLTLKLLIGNKPIRSHRENLIIRAENSQGRQEQIVTLDITPVDAPDIYLLAGQSNMVGTSLSRDRVSAVEDAKNDEPGGLDAVHPRIQQINVQSNDFAIFNNPDAFKNVGTMMVWPYITPAEDPLHQPNTKKGGATVGLGLSFAKAALGLNEKNIILVPTAWGDTGFCKLDGHPHHSWNPDFSDKSYLGGTGLFDRAVVRTNRAIAESGGILRGIIWQQGARDTYSGDCAAEYEKNLIKLAAAFRNRIITDRRGGRARGAESDVPFVVGTRSRGRDANTDRSIFNDRETIIDNVHKSVASIIPYAASAVHDYIVPPLYPCGDGGCFHYGARGLREMGRNHFQAFTSVLD